MDPRTILTIRANSRKTVHITQFLTEITKKMLQSRKRDFVLSNAGPKGSLVIKTEDEHPYAGISLDEWSAANRRILAFFLILASYQETKWSIIWPTQPKFMNLCQGITGRLFWTLIIDIVNESVNIDLHGEH